MMRKVGLFNVLAIALGLAFLYLPIAVLVLYSFNASRLVTVWGGWSTRWYGELAGDAAILDAAFNSLSIAVVSASAATLIGVVAALALFRLGRFRGRLIFASVISRHWSCQKSSPVCRCCFCSSPLPLIGGFGPWSSPTPRWRCVS